MDDLTNALWSLLPTAVLGLAFWWIIRAIVNADRNERDALAKYAAEEDAKSAREI